jgi:hypothetical protein
MSPSTSGMPTRSQLEKPPENSNGIGFRGFFGDLPPHFRWQFRQLVIDALPDNENHFSGATFFTAFSDSGRVQGVSSFKPSDSGFDGE